MWQPPFIGLEALVSLHHMFLICWSMRRALKRKSTAQKLGRSLFWLPLHIGTDHIPWILLQKLVARSNQCLRPHAGNDGGGHCGCQGQCLRSLDSMLWGMCPGAAEPAPSRTSGIIPDCRVPCWSRFLDSSRGVLLHVRGGRLTTKLTKFRLQRLSLPLALPAMHSYFCKICKSKICNFSELRPLTLGAPGWHSS